MQLRQNFISYFLLLSISLLVVSCGNNENAVSTVAASDSIEDLETAQTLKAGSLSGTQGYSSAGDIELIFSEETKTYSVVIENFSSSNGPDLRVYLAEGNGISNFLDLGVLKSTNGTLRYDFSADDFDPNFDHVLIWCRKFGAKFGEAILQTQ